MKKLVINILSLSFLSLAPVLVSAQIAPGADGLVRPPGVESSTQCMQLGGQWTPNTFVDGKAVGTYNPYECGFTPAQYNKSFNANLPVPSNGTPAGTENTFCTGGSCTYVPLEPLPGLPNKYGPGNSFGSIIPGVFKLLIGAGATIAIVMIVLGALTYMFSDIVGNKKKALDRIRGAMWAIVLLLSSYLILYTLNPDLVQFKLNLSDGKNFNITPTPPGAVNVDQMTPAQRQAAIDQCRQEGKTVHPRSDGTLACQ